MDSAPIGRTLGVGLVRACLPLLPALGEVPAAAPEEEGPLQPGSPQDDIVGVFLMAAANTVSGIFFQAVDFGFGRVLVAAYEGLAPRGPAAFQRFLSRDNATKIFRADNEDRRDPPDTNRREGIKWERPAGSPGNRLLPFSGAEWKRRETPLVRFNPLFR